jgi:hypothetical protein
MAFVWCVFQKHCCSLNVGTVTIFFVMFCLYAGFNVWATLTEAVLNQQAPPDPEPAQQSTKQEWSKWISQVELLLFSIHEWDLWRQYQLEEIVIQIGYDVNIDNKVGFQKIAKFYSQLVEQWKSGYK